MIYSLRTKIIVGSLIIIIPLFLFMLYLNFYSKDTLRKQVSQTHHNILKLHFENFDKQIKSIDDYLFKMLLHDNNLKSMENYPHGSTRYIYSKYSLLNKFKVDINYYENVDSLYAYRYDANDILATNQFDNDPDLAELRKKWLNTKITESPINRWEIYQTEYESSLIRIISTHTRNIFVGTWIDLNQLLIPLQSIDLGSEAEILITNNEGFSLTALHQFPANFHFPNMDSLKVSDYLTLINPNNDLSYLVVGRNSTMSPVNFLVLIPEKELMRPFNFFKSTIFLIPSIVLILLLFFYIYMHRVVHHPISELLTGMTSVGKGDFKISLPENKKGEFGVLLSSFNRMVGQIKELNIWELQRPAIVDKFWQNILSGHSTLNYEWLESMIKLLRIPMNISGKVTPILISIEEWKQDYNAKDEITMEYAIRKTAEEIILNGLTGDVIQSANQSIYVLLYTKEEMEQSEQIKANCEEFIQACQHYFCKSISCYIGTPSSIDLLHKACQGLLEMERNNIMNHSTVATYTLEIDEKRNRAFTARLLPTWIELFESGNRIELEKKFDENFADLQTQELTPESLEAIYYGLINMIFNTFHKKGISIYSVYTHEQLNPPSSVLRSLPRLKKWSKHLILSGCDSLHHHKRENDHIITKIQQYIGEHLEQELSREQLATKVHLNPSYLSRLFKKETGMSITEYILDLRMIESKRLLSNSNLKVNKISEMIGYHNVSHFTKMFKKFTGVTPNEYRSQYMNEIYKFEQ